MKKIIELYSILNNYIFYKYLLMKNLVKYITLFININVKKKKLYKYKKIFFINIIYKLNLLFFN